MHLLKSFEMRMKLRRGKQDAYLLIRPVKINLSMIIWVYTETKEDDLHLALVRAHCISSYEICTPAHRMVVDARIYRQTRGLFLSDLKSDKGRHASELKSKHAFECCKAVDGTQILMGCLTSKGTSNHLPSLALFDPGTSICHICRP
jgi:hypothetical protein